MACRSKALGHQYHQERTVLLVNLEKKWSQKEEKWRNFQKSIITWGISADLQAALKWTCSMPCLPLFQPSSPFFLTTSLHFSVFLEAVQMLKSPSWIYSLPSKILMWIFYNHLLLSQTGNGAEHQQKNPKYNKTPLKTTKNPQNTTKEKVPDLEISVLS